MIDLLYGMIIGAIVALLLFYLWLRMALNRAEQELEELVMVIKSVSAPIIKARVERHHDVFYIYNAEDQSFMAQGSNMAELRQRLESRWKDAQVFVTDGDEEIIQALKATIVDTKATHA